MPGNTIGHTVQGVGCRHLISAIAGSSPTDGKDICLLCFVVCCVGSGLWLELITGIGERETVSECVSKFVCLETSKTRFRSQLRFL